MDSWTLTYEGFEPAREGLRESLFTLGNGYFATRAAAPESRADGVHYPGTYIAGCYNRTTSYVAGREVENEETVNAPNWLPLTFSAEGGPWLGEGGTGPNDQSLELSLRTGVLTRTFHYRDSSGRTTRVRQRRLVSMAEPHLAALEVELTPQNWSGTLGVRSALDGTVTNAGVQRYRQLNGRHLVPRGTGGAAPAETWLRSEASASGIGIAVAARTRVTCGPVPCTAVADARPDWIGNVLRIEAVRGRPVTVEKTVALHTSRDHAIGDPLTAARASLARAGGFADLMEDHALAWRHLWQNFTVDAGDAGDRRILRLHLFHLLQTLSPHTADLDVGVPARGLHGEAYRGHVFWDELFVFPLLNLHLPETARALLRYRRRRLPQARAAARAQGLRGALFPWQSGSDGREETQRLHLNPRSGRWRDDNSHLQRHVGIAIAYNTWQHYRITGDAAFLEEIGAELLLEIARSFADLTSYDRRLGRYVLRGVMGPDEYHDGYPDREEPGVDDNAYTNVMTVWVLQRALEALQELPETARRQLRERIGLTAAETQRFERICARMRVPFHDGVISQFAGYQDLAELDWSAYRARYGDIRRLDRILEAEGDTCNRYRASKQADVLMLFFLLSAEELREILHSLGYGGRADDAGLIPRTVDYYLARTSHGSTLSAVVHAWVLSRTDRAASWRFLREALRSDIDDSQGGSTAEGIHLGAMAGTVDVLIRCYTGLSAQNGVMRLNPALPPELPHLSFHLRFAGHHGVRLDIGATEVRVTPPHSSLPPLAVECRGHSATASPGATRVLPTR
ncbi:glycoside hydrolase family 65 protein [Streptomonospora wellingtoniae]|uniref:Glycosyl hydrolase family 65 protein n=1 Tax=Streptomonospora wellingtoniae TaxID=3075544 RepID=A0ABU2L1Q6_9ACTN|nr:glycosyl hydrolase family 65 protein [Streptomonospora sp. DSM 45055]MDT0305198.1 glycosyl hydrolase family 65 protein [Streptomonospora sp. DSM 45055]